MRPKLTRAAAANSPCLGIALTFFAQAKKKARPVSQKMARHWQNWLSPQKIISVSSKEI
jgi:hypothetical protein